MIRRVFITPKKGYDTLSRSLLEDLKQNLNIKSLENLQIFNRYDLSVEDSEEYHMCVDNVLSQVNTDDIYHEKLPKLDTENIIIAEYLPGQFDQRANSATQCMHLLNPDTKIIVKNARVYALFGDISNDDMKKIENYLINPVDSRVASSEKPESLDDNEVVIEKTPVIENFINLDSKKLLNLLKEMELAMDIDDFSMIQEYFKNEEKRDPTLTEIKVLDTYWSDHCRHTTFSTILENVEFSNDALNDEMKDIYSEYLNLRKDLYKDKDKPITLMDMAVIGTKAIKNKGLLDDLEESDEINACSIRANVDVDGVDEKYLIMFKNETHNHPTEIEPFGGAATCLGGAIRDPLSGRAYVYQSMRVTGSGDPNTPYEETLKGKLSQKKITKGAAEGFSSYGNQIGLQTGQVKEYYHPDYVAKRMEVGAVIACAKEENVKREKPLPGDIIILVGGRTGRDGIGGASGSSKEHTNKSVETAGSEVQKGNAPEERKLQRLFRNEKVAKMIKKCNDFGAGGVCVAVGELADSLEINLDNVLKKYEGLNATELAISESQERMAVVIDKNDKEAFISYAVEENLEASEVAVVTDNGRIKITFQSEEVLNLKRSFIDTNGAKKKTGVKVLNSNPTHNSLYNKDKSHKENFSDIIKNLNVCSQKGLIENFDNTIGSTNVLMPSGGKYMLSEIDGMVSKIPLIKGNTKTVTVMTNGFDPYQASENPYIGAVYAVLNSITKQVALGVDYKKIRLSLQEYFERLKSDETRWAKPFIALLGALKVQLEMNTPAIGGKDSMSGSFNELDVPPTLISFAVGLSKTDNIVSSEFKKVGSYVYVIPIKRTKNFTPEYESVRNNYDAIHKLILEGRVLSSKAVGFGGVAEAVSKMSFGNKIGFDFSNDFDYDIYSKNYGDIILEVSKELDPKEINSILIGKTNDSNEIRVGSEKILIEELITLYEKPLSKIFPIYANEEKEVVDIEFKSSIIKKANIKVPTPKVIIPVFPGTNCEYDTAKAFNEAGGSSDIFVFRNNTTQDILYSVKELEKRIKSSQILALPGGFSASDEPDGSAKFIVAVLKNERIKDAIMDLINNRDGLILGICNGFQALIKTGLLPYGEIRDLDETSPTLTYNNIGRHISNVSYAKVSSNMSIWLKGSNVGDVYINPLSHGEGRFVCNEEMLKTLIENGQVGMQYCDINGNVSTSPKVNPNGSTCSIECITSKDGRILGKMGHSERVGEGLYKNIHGNMNQGIFKNGINYFK